MSRAAFTRLAATGAAVAGLFALAPAADAAGAQPCGASGSLSGSAPSLSCTYTAAGEDSFTVPAGVTSVAVRAVGAAGGAGGSYLGLAGGAGGAAALVDAPAVAVTPGSVLYVEVATSGANGSPGGEGCGAASAAGGGGGGGGGSSNCAAGGGGGGGSSDLRSAPAIEGGLTAAAGDPRLVVAAGGAGGGGAGSAAGGAGGAGGAAVADGAGAGGSGGCAGGASPSAGAGGAGGSGAGGGGAGIAPSGPSCGAVADGAAGAPGAGGSGGNGVSGVAGGGGGGGGFTGGGGGGIAAAGGGGGGGGSSEGPAGTIYAIAAPVAQPQVAISWSAAAPSASVATPANGAVFVQGQAVESMFSCADGAGGMGVASCLDGAGEQTGAPVDTSTPGPHTYTVDTTSLDGLGASATVTYTVEASPPAPAAAAVAAAAGTPPAPSAVTLPAHGVDPYLTGERALAVRIACRGATSCAVDATASITLPGTRQTLYLGPASAILSGEHWTTLRLQDPRALRRAVRAYARAHRRRRLEIALTITDAAGGGMTTVHTYLIRVRTSAHRRR